MMMKSFDLKFFLSLNMSINKQNNSLLECFCVVIISKVLFYLFNVSLFNNNC